MSNTRQKIHDDKPLSQSVTHRYQRTTVVLRGTGSAVTQAQPVAAAGDMAGKPQAPVAAPPASSRGLTARTRALLTAAHAQIEAASVAVRTPPPRASASVSGDHAAAPSVAETDDTHLLQPARAERRRVDVAAVQEHLANVSVAALHAAVSAWQPQQQHAVSRFRPVTSTGTSAGTGGTSSAIMAAAAAAAADAHPAADTDMDDVPDAAILDDADVWDAAQTDDDPEAGDGSGASDGTGATSSDSESDGNRDLADGDDAAEPPKMLLAAAVAGAVTAVLPAAGAALFNVTAWYTSMLAMLGSTGGVAGGWLISSMTMLMRRMGVLSYWVYLFNLKHVLSHLTLCWFVASGNSYHTTNMIMVIIAKVVLSLTQVSLYSTVNQMISRNHYLRTYLAIDPLIMCQRCFKTYALPDCIAPGNQVKHCMHVEFPQHSMEKFRVPCQMALLGLSKAKWVKGLRVQTIQAYPEQKFIWLGTFSLSGSVATAHCVTHPQSRRCGFPLRY